MKHIALFLLMLCAPLWCAAQSASPTALYTTADGEELEDASTGVSAPLVAHFEANPQDADGWAARYEWVIYESTDANTYLVHRFDEELDYTFAQSGTFYVQLTATFTLEGDTVTWPEEGDEDPIVVSISESKLDFPNAFSPNGDGYNDVYRAKDGYQSIVSFHATIINRWGQKLFEWSDLAEGWDGTFNGRTVKDGVYYVIVEARGADGKHYRIRRDVNVLTGYRNSSSSDDDD